jgi:hypothetical protein
VQGSIELEQVAAGRDPWPRSGQWARVSPGLYELKAGEQQPTVMIGCPRCEQPVSLKNHDVTFHEDGSFTARPSVLHQPCGWHVYIDRSIAVDC